MRRQPEGTHFSPGEDCREAVEARDRAVSAEIEHASGAEEAGGVPAAPNPVDGQRSLKTFETSVVLARRAQLVALLENKFSPLVDCISGEPRYRVEDTEWHRITAFNGQAASVEKGLTKGMKVAVRGRIHNTEWTDRESGQKRYSYEIIAEEISFLSRGKASTPNRDTSDDDTND